MSQITIFFPGRLPDLNDIVAAAKSSRGKFNGYARLKKKWSCWCAEIIRECGLPVMESVCLTFCFTEKNRMRDQDNVSAGAKKFILDGLVKAGVIKNDGWKQIRAWGADRFEVNKHCPGVTVTICDGVEAELDALHKLETDLRFF